MQQILSRAGLTAATDFRGEKRLRVAAVVDFGEDLIVGWVRGSQKRPQRDGDLVHTIGSAGGVDTIDGRRELDGGYRRKRLVSMVQRDGGALPQRLLSSRREFTDGLATNQHARVDFASFQKFVGRVFPRIVAWISALD